MGLIPPKPPPDYGPGPDCLACHAPGRTPNYVFVRFWNIVQCSGCEAPPNGYTFICKQEVGFPCRYSGTLEFGGGTWLAQYVAHIFHGGVWKSTLQLTRVAGACPAHFADEGAPCAVEFLTPYTSCPTWGGTGGTGHVLVYTAVIIITLTNCLHFCTLQGVRYEHFQCGMDHHIFRLANVNGKTNCLFYIDEEDVEVPDLSAHPPPW